MYFVVLEERDVFMISALLVVLGLLALFAGRSIMLAALQT